jgi:hypothetical protein
MTMQAQRLSDFAAMEICDEQLFEVVGGRRRHSWPRFDIDIFFNFTINVITVDGDGNVINNQIGDGNSASHLAS